MRHKISVEKSNHADTVALEQGMQQTQALKRKFLEAKAKKGNKAKVKNESSTPANGQTQHSAPLAVSLPRSVSLIGTE